MLTYLGILSTLWGIAFHLFVSLQKAQLGNHAQQRRKDAIRRLAVMQKSDKRFVGEARGQRLVRGFVQPLGL